MWSVHQPVNDRGIEGKKVTTVIDRAGGWAMHLAEGVQHESWAASLSWAPRPEAPISLTALHPRLQASAPPRLHSYCSFVVHMCTLLQATSERDRRRPSWGDALGYLRACKFCVGFAGRSCMRPGCVMGCFGCFTVTGLGKAGRDGEARIRQREPSHCEGRGQSRICAV